MGREEFKEFPLRDYGFKKYRCRKCGEYFWSMVPRETCPDRPCSRYEFLYKEYRGMRSLSFNDAREKFIEYFKSKNHGYIEPYPVLARWRNDLYLTIASIIVFQPMVTSGLIDPPYNPLVIVQPSVRLEDIDNVGLTFGRHLTSFEMGGHHAFNREGHEIYWIKETVEYAYEFFTREIGIPGEAIVFKESWWEGGGNAGPAYEVVVDGMELATLVFMEYRVVDGEYEPNPVYVVDTGYGIERIAWFTRRKPTAYHVIYGDLLNTYKNILGLEEPPYDVLKKIVYLLSGQEISGIDMLKKMVIDIGFNEYVDQVINSINLYTVLDHSKTLLLLLSDGIVPSNTGEGYLARLVLRRLLRTLLRIGIEVSGLEELVLELLYRQASYWRNTYVYDKFYKNLDYIDEIVSIETRKFIDSLTRGIDMVDKIIKKKKKISEKDLYEIYDSHGIPPEIIVERARKHGIDLRVPDNFYARVAELHGGSGVLVKEKEHELSRDIVEWVKSFNYTKPVFHKDPYAVAGKARVLGVRDKYVVFDRTIFYPKAGGQDDDKGYIVYSGRKYRVVNVYKVGDVIVHELETRPDIPIGSEVELEIDWSRRYILMRHHTATHVLLGVLRKLYGNHVWQAGVEKTVEKARLDITHYKTFTREEIEKIEREANKIVDQHIDVAFHYMDKFDAEKKYGLRIYQGGAIYSPILRIVEIPGVDVEACYGTHVYNTSEIGGIKILRVDKIQDGVIRLEYTVATRLPKYIEQLVREKEEALKILNTRQSSLVDVARNIKKNLDEYRGLLNSYRKTLYKLLVEEAYRNKRTICNIPLIIIEKKINDQQLYKNLVEELVLKKKNIAIIYDDKLVEIAVNPELANNIGIDLRQVINILKREEQVKGGGKKDHIIIRTENTYEIMEKTIKLLEKQICKNKSL